MCIVCHTTSVGIGEGKEKSRVRHPLNKYRAGLKKSPSEFGCSCHMGAGSKLVEVEYP